MKFFKNVKRDKEGWFYLGMAMVILNNFVLSGVLSLIVTIAGLGLVIYGLGGLD
ncbi:hypothetical protein FC15_GL001737 [Lapidilactobacillus concavus DSM 17758]|uniref:Uncharacterized protein n=1 Tax=Lapidilactobacillus concavus DSM 17758 TaxID=1423735 RepID=A0A0R1VU64_9LACO|nr:hypothetical protein [Lapidilactobacillus concavus]KRM09090.1 hypothetical protein FC15_GL001737 [Lapidilactobacillus concavus DSM 17758]GEL13614.1 hypothetical protein LCO01nite_11630 [Lapidilactobacillus concavus]